ncbi:MAG: alpha/beta hydrolase [Subtercola sp.]|nr:alpha/beta hydrolase [Subtercola sp.]
MNRLQKAGYWMLDYAYTAADELRAAADRRSAEERFAAASASGRPVVLIAGVFETWAVLRTVGAEAARIGHPVHVVEELGRNTETLEASARVIASYLESHDLRHVVLLAHSKGGLVGKYLMLRFDAERRIDGLVAINAPFSGSQWGRVMRAQSVRALGPSDRVVQFLQATHDVDSRIVSVYSTFDQNVWAGSRLEGARRNVRLNVAGHSRILGTKALVPLLPEAISWLPPRPAVSRSENVTPGPSPH